MVKFSRSVIFLSFVALLVLAGAPSVTAQSSKFPVGSYESGPFTIIFKDGGNFEVAHSSGGGVKGTYKVSGDQVEVTDVEGEFACPDAVGKYTWKVEGEKLVMNIVADPCDGRAEAFSIPLKKKGGK